MMEPWLAIETITIGTTRIPTRKHTHTHTHTHTIRLQTCQHTRTHILAHTHTLTHTQKRHTLWFCIDRVLHAYVCCSVCCAVCCSVSCNVSCSSRCSTCCIEECVIMYSVSHGYTRLFVYLCARTHRLCHKCMPLCKRNAHGVGFVSRIDTIIGLFCKRAL